MSDRRYVIYGVTLAIVAVVSVVWVWFGEKQMPSELDLKQLAQMPTPAAKAGTAVQYELEVGAAGGDRQPKGGILSGLGQQYGPVMIESKVHIHNTTNQAVLVHMAGAALQSPERFIDATSGVTRKTLEHMDDKETFNTSVEGRGGAKRDFALQPLETRDFCILTAIDDDEYTRLHTPKPRLYFVFRCGSEEVILSNTVQGTCYGL
jgi:hypothetical protein